MPKYLTSSVFTFQDLILGDFLYVDKTEFLWKLVQAPKGVYFLSRPRRFGKSLTVSTLKAIFEGHRELFRGLSIGDKPYDWQVFPVIHLDLCNCNSHSAEHLQEFLGLKLEDVVRQFQLTASVKSDQLAASFSAIIRELHGKSGPVVLLIDEYDKPLLENLVNGKAAEIRDVLSDFYSTIKLEDSRERFVFLTGVSKFCQVSIFSKLNNLRDISMSGDYATMLGYTQEELEKNFGEWIVESEGRQALPREQFMAKIKEWYDGFRFHQNAEAVYNPVSLAEFFLNHGEFRNYWFSTGTPTFLMELLKSTRFDFEKALREPVDEIAFSAYEIGEVDPMSLLLQTGYLTIKDSWEEWEVRKYRVGFPNHEVKAAFNAYLLNAYSGVGRQELNNLLVKMLNNMRDGHTAEFMDVLQTFLANIPYDIQLKDEKYYQSVIYVLFLTLGTMVQAEVCTNKGRIDAIAVFEERVYIFEFKLNQSAQAAMEQIRNREYCQKFRQCGKTIHLLGINLSTESRQVTQWLEEIEE